jgi:hypothetical protein
MEVDMSRMVRCRHLWVLVLAVVAAAPAAAAPGGSGWGQYRDREAGVAFDFPGHVFAIDSAEQSRQGTVFTSTDGRARIRVFGFVNEAGDTPARYLRRVARPEDANFTYVRTTSRFFVASGTRDGMIFYRRCNFAGGSGQVGCLQLDYPQGDKRAFDPVVTRISRSLRVMTR